MFERLLDILVQAGTRLLPFQIVPVAEGAGVLRFGKYHRTAAPGFHWKWPLVETFNVQNTCVTTIRLQPQTLTTKDDKQVVIAAIVKYQIIDVEPYITQIWDQHDVLADVTMGAIQQQVRAHTWAELDTAALEKTIATAVRRQVNRFGFEIHAVTFTDVGLMRSLRLITHTPLNLDN